MTKTYGMNCKANGESGFTSYSLHLSHEDAFKVSNLASDRVGREIRLSSDRTMIKTSATELAYHNPHSPGSGRGAILIIASMHEGLDDIVEQSRFDRSEEDDD